MTYELKSYQKNLIDKIQECGFKKGEMMIVSAGRQSGKSMLNAMYGKIWAEMMTPQPAIKKLDHAVVDGERWFTMQCDKESSAWLREQDETLWHEHIDNKWYTVSGAFDIHEKLANILVLKYS